MMVESQHEMTESIVIFPCLSFFLPGFPSSLILSTLRVINILLLATVSPSNRIKSMIANPRRCQTNSPCQHLNKCIENRIENMHTAFRSKVLMLRRIIYLFYFFPQCFEPCNGNPILELAAIKNNFHLLHWTCCTSTVPDTNCWETDQDLKSFYVQSILK